MPSDNKEHILNLLSTMVSAPAKGAEAVAGQGSRAASAGLSKGGEMAREGMDIAGNTMRAGVSQGAKGALQGGSAELMQNMGDRGLIPEGYGLPQQQNPQDKLMALVERHPELKQILGGMGAQQPQQPPQLGHPMPQAQQRPSPQGMPQANASPEMMRQMQPG